MNRLSLSAFFVAAAMCAFIWALAPLLTGHTEPWDADGLFYPGSLVLTGLVAGGLMPKSLWAHYLGAIVGQLGYELLFLKVGALALLGAVFLLGYSLIFLAAAASAAYLRNKVGTVNERA